MLKPAYRDAEPLVYKIETYKGQKEDKWDIQKVINDEKIDKQLQYKVKWVGYKDTTQELKDNFKNTIKKVEEYYRKVDQVVEKKKSQRKINQLKAIDEILKTKTLPPKYQLFPPQLDWNPFWLSQLPVHKNPVPQNGIFWNVFFYKPSQDRLTKYRPQNKC